MSAAASWKRPLSMIPGIDAAHISTAMRAVELSGRLRRANERVSEYQNALPIAALWGDGTKGSADMMAMDASRHLWTARVDPRRRTYAAGLYTHVRDRWGLFYDQPVVLNERQAGVAVEGVEQHNRAEDRIRISLLAVDTHGVTNVAMAIAKLLGFDLCPRLRDLRERKLFVPRGWPVPESLEGVTVRRVSVKAIERGWDDLVRLAASIRAGNAQVSSLPSSTGTTPAQVFKHPYLLDALGLRQVAEYWTELPPKAELERQLHAALVEARERLAGRRLLLGRPEDE